MTKAAATAARTPLAINGGAPLRTAPFPFWPQYEPDEVEAVTAVLRSGKVNYWTGEEGRRFEQEYAAALDTRYAVAVANGSVALELALYALGIGRGDEVIVPSRTFIASASCVLLRGATPVFADVDRDSGTITAASADAALSPRTRAIITVHLGGWPCDMDPILEYARDRHIHVIEDCAQAHGAVYKGRAVGSLGDVNAFSFCQDKISSTGGEGGLLTTGNEQWWQRAWSYKDHGKSYEAVYRRQHPAGFRWLHESRGTNWRLTESQAALGRVLLRKLPAQVERRRRNAALLHEGFARIAALRVPVPPTGVLHSYYKFYVYLRPECLRAGWDRNRICAAINAEGIPCFSGSCSEVYLEKAFAARLRPKRRLPIARELGETCLMFLVHPTITEQDCADTVAAVEKVMAAAACQDVP